MEQDADLTQLTLAINTAAQHSLLADLGIPTIAVVEGPTVPDTSLVWLHLGSAWLKLSIIAQLAEFYCNEAGQPLSWLGYGSTIESVGGSAGARQTATGHYRNAARANPNLAEAQFALGRTAQLAGDPDQALTHFRACADRKPHPGAPTEAYLKANAHWELACILEDRGDDAAAMSAFRTALSALDSFGVHHVRFAKFLRRLGHDAEAADHYLACARYTHRYFPEFQLPPLETPAPVTPPTTLDAIFTTNSGESIYFHAGRYILIPAGTGPLDAHKLAQLAGPDSTPPAGRRQMAINVLSRLLKPKRRKAAPRLADAILDLID